MSTAALNWNAAGRPAAPRPGRAEVEAVHPVRVRIDDSALLDTVFRDPTPTPAFPLQIGIASQLDRGKTGAVLISVKRMKTEGGRPDGTTYDCLPPVYAGGSVCGGSTAASATSAVARLGQATYIPEIPVLSFPGRDATLRLAAHWKDVATPWQTLKERQCVQASRDGFGVDNLRAGRRAFAATRLTVI